MFSLFVIDVLRTKALSTGLIVRVHAGTVRNSDHVTEVRSPAGTSEQVDLRIAGLALSQTIRVDQLDHNYGGRAAVSGALPPDFGPEWLMFG